MTTAITRNEGKCATCGKPIKDNVQYLSVDQPCHPSCWETHYDARYLNASQRIRFQQAFAEDAKQFSLLKEKLADTDRVYSESQTEITGLRDSICNLRKSFAKICCDYFKLHEFFSIQPMQNVTSILEHGLLSYNRLKAQGITHSSLSNPEIQERRSQVVIEAGRSANDYVSLFFSRKTPMQYRIYYDKKQDELVYFCIKREILGESGVVFSDGNVAAELSGKTTIFLDLEKLTELDWTTIWRLQWNDSEERRKKSAEVLVPDRIDPSWFDRIIVHDEKARLAIQEMIKGFPSIPIEIDLFDPYRKSDFYF